jgi:hypothetical protein
MWTRFMAPGSLAKVKDEVERLCKTIWEPSSSPIASPMVVAAKATPPFVRIVGDYRVINKFVKVFHFPIPNVIHEIHKVMRFSLYSDVDFMNAFHQLRLSPESSAYLSVQTPPQIKLAMSLRYLAGGNPLEFCFGYGISDKTFYSLKFGIWNVLEAIYEVTKDDMTQHKK